MDKFINWYKTYYDEITWFIIGFLVHDGLTDLVHGNYLGALISLGLAWVNYHFYKRM
jgi:hypothetical protein